MTTLADRAAAIKLDGLDKAKHDPRGAGQFLADLEAETRASLRRDPTRWPWVRSGTLPRSVTNP